MVTKTTLRPGQKGTKRLAKKYGDRLVCVRYKYWETDVREKVKAAGGIWRPRQKVWEMRYGSVVALGVE